MTGHFSLVYFFRVLLARYTVQIEGSRYLGCVRVSGGHRYTQNYFFCVQLDKKTMQKKNSGCTPILICSLFINTLLFSSLHSCLYAFFRSIHTHLPLSRSPLSLNPIMIFLLLLAGRPLVRVSARLNVQPASTLSLHAPNITHFPAITAANFVTYTGLQLSARLPLLLFSCCHSPFFYEHPSCITILLFFITTLIHPVLYRSASPLLYRIASLIIHPIRISHFFRHLSYVTRLCRYFA